MAPGSPPRRTTEHCACGTPPPGARWPSWRGTTALCTRARGAPTACSNASGSREKTVRVWDVATQRVVAKLEGHRGDVNGCAWSPDGTQLCTASDDKTVRVWNVSTEREVAKLEGHALVVCSCAWGPEGTRLASASWDNTVCVWLAPPVTPMIADDPANVAHIPGSTLEAENAHLRRKVEEHRKARERWRLAAERVSRVAGVANTRARRLEGDPEALQQCSLEELRQLVTDSERGGARARDALTRAESRAAAADSAEAATFRRICLERPKDQR